jgi:putative membrane protein
MPKFVISTIVTALALWISTLILSGITLNTPSTLKKIGTLILVAVIFGVVNGVLRPIIRKLGCALYFFTLGLISFLVNGLLFLLVSWISGKLGLPFHVDGLLTAILGAIVVSVVSWLINLAVDRIK